MKHHYKEVLLLGFHGNKDHQQGAYFLGGWKVPPYEEGLSANGFCCHLSIFNKEILLATEIRYRPLKAVEGRGSGIFLRIGDRNPIHPQALGSCGPLQE